MDYNEVTESGARHYIQDGIRYPSSTTITGVLRAPFLETWRGTHGNAEADRKRDHAAAIGTQIHLACSEVVKGITTEYDRLPTDQKIMVDKFYHGWFLPNVTKVLSIEETGYNKLYRYTGTPDLIAELRGWKGAVIIDIKTGYVGPSARLQLASYMNLDGVVAEGRLVVQVDRKNEGNITPFPFYKHVEDWQAFLNCLALYRWQQGG